MSPMCAALCDAIGAGTHVVVQAQSVNLTGCEEQLGVLNRPCDRPSKRDRSDVVYEQIQWVESLIGNPARFIAMHRLHTRGSCYQQSNLNQTKYRFLFVKPFEENL
jgi:hypothetical protein